MRICPLHSTQCDGYACIAAPTACVRVSVSTVKGTRAFASLLALHESFHSVWDSCKGAAVLRSHGEEGARLSLSLSLLRLRRHLPLPKLPFTLHRLSLSLPRLVPCALRDGGPTCKSVRLHTSYSAAARRLR